MTAFKKGDDVIRRTLSGVMPGKVLYVHQDGTHARVQFGVREKWSEDIAVGELRFPWTVQAYGSGTINVADSHEPGASYIYTIVRGETVTDDTAQRIRYKIAGELAEFMNGGGYPVWLMGTRERECPCTRGGRVGKVKKQLKAKRAPHWEWVACPHCRGTGRLKIVRRVDEETIIADYQCDVRIGGQSVGMVQVEVHLVATGPVFDADPPNLNWQARMDDEAKDMRARLVDRIWNTPARLASPNSTPA